MPPYHSTIKSSKVTQALSYRQEHFSKKAIVFLMVFPYMFGACRGWTLSGIRYSPSNSNRLNK